MNNRNIVDIGNINNLGMVLYQINVGVSIESSTPASPFTFTSSCLLQPCTAPPLTHDFKHSDRSIFAGPSFIYCQVVVLYIFIRAVKIFNHYRSL